MSKTDVERKINQILELFIPHRDIDGKIERENFRTLGIDSIIFVQIVVMLEEEFNINFSDEMLLVDNIESINNLYKLINKLMGD